MSITLGGNVVIRNGNRLDYTWRECIQSLLPVCEEIVVADGESDDGTLEELREWVYRETKIKLFSYPWPHPRGQITFFTDWLNWARERITCDYQCQIDSDEILSENSYDEILKFKRDTNPGDKVSLWAARYNFWRNAQHLIPHGECCSHRVVRIAPQATWLPSDGPDPRGAEAIGMAQESKIEIFHYGFLRRKEAFFLKARELQKMFFNSYDERLAAVERKLILEGENAKGNWMSEIDGLEWKDKLIPYDGTHPALAHAWLKERGYEFQG